MPPAVAVVPPAPTAPAPQKISVRREAVAARSPSRAAAPAAPAKRVATSTTSGRSEARSAAAPKAVHVARLSAGPAPTDSRSELRRGPPGDGAKPNRYRPADEEDYEDAEDELYDDGDPKPDLGVLSYIAVEAVGPAQGRLGVHVDGGADYTIRRTSGGELELTLYDTRAANLDVRRVLDARALDGRVRRVLPSVEEYRQRVVLTVELREPSRVDVTEADGMLWLGFADTDRARGATSR